ncbi:MAG: Na+/H+ antiporter NhaA [Rhodospirillales bacterium]|nr:Na+/H+ antiporter NhaA [Acetobacter sp.]
MQASSRTRVITLLTFLRSETAAGLALILAALAALVWSNSPYASDYRAWMDLPLGIHAGDAGLNMSLDRWINDGLMAVFFLTVGLEIRREMTEGHLNSWRRRAAPSFAALGGMVVPALIYVAFNWRNPETLRGWAVPVATDIAFVLAAVSALGRRVPIGLKVFLTALAIIDDLGAIVVIAGFYTSQLAWVPLTGAGLILGVLFLLRLTGLRSLSLYILGGFVLWGCVLHSGIHPTLAGVALAFVIPQREDAAGNSPARRLESGLGGWVTWGVLPLFGLANAGLTFGTLDAGSLIRPVTLGTALGLLVGKQIGVFGATMLALKLRLATIPAGLTLAQLYAGSILCGIGFTMSLFIGDLSFHGTPLHAEVKLATFVGSVLAAMLGLVVLAGVTRHPVDMADRKLERT